MNRFDLHHLSRLRVKEAKVLLDHKCHEGAYYLLGYAVECALKACIAKQTKRFDFPDQKTVNKSYVHDLNQLLELSGVKSEHEKEIQSNRVFELNWAIVKDWSEKARYSGQISETEAIGFYSAVVSRRNGVLSWLKKRW
ncbi:MAG: DNA-binding protein [Candidatus Latescibacteria bacterium]|nr:DNA-binding protein [Candidatus Latescibacterota bacterium]